MATQPVVLKGLRGSAGQHGLRVEQPRGELASNDAQINSQFSRLATTLPPEERGWDGDDKDWIGYSTKVGYFSTAVGGQGGDGGDGGKGGDANGGGGIGGDGGDGGDGGMGGSALASISGVTPATGSSNDRIGLFSTAVGGRGGDGGTGGRGGDARGGTAGDGGDGGNAGIGGSAEARIMDISLWTGGGNDKISLHAKAIGGVGGAGGRAGRSGQGDDGTAGAAGESGDGGTAAARIQNLDIDTGQGNDNIVLNMVVRAGNAGRGPGPAGDNGTSSIALKDNGFYGGEGNDTFKISSRTNTASTSYDVSGNTFDGGSGQDKLDFTGWATRIAVNLLTDKISFGSQSDSNAVVNIETIVGTNYADQFVSSSEGITVIGGGGADRFEISSARQVKADVISDFSRKDGDKLVINVDLFQGLSADAMTLITVADVASASNSGGGYFVYDRTGADAGTLYYDPSGGAATDAFRISVLSNKAVLNSYDFALV